MSSSSLLRKLHIALTLINFGLGGDPGKVDIFFIFVMPMNDRGHEVDKPCGKVQGSPIVFFIITAGFLMR
jgi:hypothetical protein